VRVIESDYPEEVLLFDDPYAQLLLGHVAGMVLDSALSGRYL
jgi:O-methyltransferase involved in polyketide biosynthesis